MMFISNSLAFLLLCSMPTDIQIEHSSTWLNQKGVSVGQYVSMKAKTLVIKFHIFNLNKPLIFICVPLERIHLITFCIWIIGLHILTSLTSYTLVFAGKWRFLSVFPLTRPLGDGNEQVQ